MERQHCGRWRSVSCWGWVGYARVHADHRALLQGVFQRACHSSAHCPPVLAKPESPGKLRHSTSRSENQRDPA